MDIKLNYEDTAVLKNKVSVAKFLLDTGIFSHSNFENEDFGVSLNNSKVNIGLYDTTMVITRPDTPFPFYFPYSNFTEIEVHLESDIYVSLKVKTPTSFNVFSFF